MTKSDLFRQECFTSHSLARLSIQDDWKVFRVMRLYKAALFLEVAAADG